MVNLLPPPPETYRPPQTCPHCKKVVTDNEWASYRAHEDCANDPVRNVDLALPSGRRVPSRVALDNSCGTGRRQGRVPKDF